MQELWGFIKNLLLTIGDYSTLYFVATSLAVVGLTQAVKIPIKKLTSKIKNDTLRKKVNLIIMVIPFGFGVAINYGLSFIGLEFNWEVGMTAGYLAEFIYCFFEKLFAKCQTEEVSETIIEDTTKEAKKETEEKKKSFTNLIDSIKF